MFDMIDENVTTQNPQTQHIHTHTNYHPFNIKHDQKVKHKSTSVSADHTIYANIHTHKNR